MLKYSTQTLAMFRLLHPHRVRLRSAVSLLSERAASGTPGKRACTGTFSPMRAAAASSRRTSFWTTHNNKQRVNGPAWLKSFLRIIRCRRRGLWLAECFHNPLSHLFFGTRRVQSETAGNVCHCSFCGRYQCD